MMGDQETASGLFDAMAQQGGAGFVDELGQRLKNIIGSVGRLGRGNQASAAAPGRGAKAAHEYNQAQKKFRREVLRDLVKKVDRKDAYYNDVCVVCVWGSALAHAVGVPSCVFVVPGVRVCGCVGV